MLTSVAMAGQAETPRAEHSFVNSKGFPTLITDSATEGLHVLSLGQKKCRLPRAVRVASTATDSSVMCLHMLTEMCLDLHVTLHEGLQVGIKQMLQIVHIDGPQVRANRRGLDKRYSYCVHFRQGCAINFPGFGTPTHACISMRRAHCSQRR